MSGITTRSVETLHLEAIKALYAADTDITADFAGGVNVGPLTANAESGDSIIVPRQINVILAPNGIFTPGVSGVTDSEIAVIVAMFDHFTEEPVTTGTGNVNSIDRLVYLRRKLSNGSESDGTGKLVNTDDPTNPSPIIKYLNTTKPVFTTVAMDVPTKDRSARMYAFLAVYETRRDNTTEARK